MCFQSVYQISYLSASCRTVLSTLFKSFKSEIVAELFDIIINDILFQVPGAEMNPHKIKEQSIFKDRSNQLKFDIVVDCS